MTVGDLVGCICITQEILSKIASKGDEQAVLNVMACLTDGERDVRDACCKWLKSRLICVSLYLFLSTCYRATTIIVNMSSTNINEWKYEYCSRPVRLCRP